LAGVVPDQALAWADGLVSLNGAPIARPVFTPGQRLLIMRSRVASTAALANAIAAATNPPAVWFSASAVGFYGDRGDEILTETAGPGQGFLAQVAQAWEAATHPARERCRVVTGRLGVVLASQGALARLVQMARLGLAGRIGSGRQYWPWIGLPDASRAIAYALSHQALAGPVNLVGPAPARQNEFSAALASQLSRPRQLAVPAGLVKAGLGASSEMLLTSQRAVSAVLEQSGFSYTLATLEATLDWALTDS